MPNFAAQLKSEIARIAKKESRAESAAIKKASSQHRADIAALKRRVAELEATIKRLTKSNAMPVPIDAGKEPSPSLRFRVSGFAALRKKLGLSAADMATLLGVSAQTIYHWESGKSRPRASQLAAIAETRKLGKNDVAARIANMQ